MKRARWYFRHAVTLLSVGNAFARNCKQTYPIIAASGLSNKMSLEKRYALKSRLTRRWTKTSFSEKSNQGTAWRNWISDKRLTARVQIGLCWVSAAEIRNTILTSRGRVKIPGTRVHRVATMYRRFKLSRHLSAGYRCFTFAVTELGKSEENMKSRDQSVKQARILLYLSKVRGFYYNTQ